MKGHLVALAITGLSTLIALGQGAVVIDNNVAPGYLDISQRGNHYSGAFGLEVWYKNGSTADAAINSLDGINASAQYALLTADGFSLATTKLNCMSAGGIFSGIGEVDIKAPGGSNPAGQPGPGLDRTVAGGNVILGLAIWTGSGTTFFSGMLGGVITFVNQTSDWTVPPPDTPLPAFSDNFPGMLMAIPEPSACALIGLGGGALFLRRRRLNPRGGSDKAKVLFLAVAIMGLGNLGVLGQGAVIIDNSLAPGYLYDFPRSEPYNGPFNLELWYKNGSVADDAINSLNPLLNAGGAYALLTADGFSLATRRLNAGTVVNGTFSGVGEVDIKAPGGNIPAGQAGPGLDRTVAGGNVILALAIWTDSGATFLSGMKGGVITFVNPTSNWMIPPPNTPVPPLTDNFPGMIIGMPEPSTFALVGTGTALLLIRLRRHR